MSLSGSSVLVAGAGLAGLVAARDLVAMGAEVTVIDARERTGGRVWTIREGFTDRQHAEAGGDLINGGQAEIRRLASELGLNLVRILRGGFAAFRQGARGRRQMRPARRVAWDTMRRQLAQQVRAYRLAERRWDSAIASAIAGESVGGWLDRVTADEEMRATTLALRGFFLAGPGDLSLLALVDQFAEDEAPGSEQMYRIRSEERRVGKECRL